MSAARKIIRHATEEQERVGPPCGTVASPRKEVRVGRGRGRLRPTQVSGWRVRGLFLCEVGSSLSKDGRGGRQGDSVERDRDYADIDAGARVSSAPVRSSASRVSISPAGSGRAK